MSTRRRTLVLGAVGEEAVSEATTELAVGSPPCRWLAPRYSRALRMALLSNRMECLQTCTPSRTGVRMRRPPRPDTRSLPKVNRKGTRKKLKGAEIVLTIGR